MIKYLEFNRISDRWGSVGDEPIEVRIEFKSGKEVINFINKGDYIFKRSGIPRSNFDKSIFKIVKIKKIKHFSIIANIEKITLREYNLEKIGI